MQHDLAPWGVVAVPAVSWITSHGNNIQKKSTSRSGTLALGLESLVLKRLREIMSHPSAGLSFAVWYWLIIDDLLCLCELESKPDSRPADYL